MRYESIYNEEKHEEKLVVDFGTDEFNTRIKTAIISILEAVNYVQNITYEDQSKSQEDPIYKKARQDAIASESNKGNGGIGSAETQPNHKPSENAPQTLPPLPPTNYSDLNGADTETEKVLQPLPPLETQQEEITFEDDI